jgi:hypothetical protein
MIDNFARKHHTQIEVLVQWTRGHVNRRKVTKELKRYVREYGISVNEACEALAMKWSGYRNTEHHSSVFNSVEPPPKFALDALEADIFTSLLSRARPQTVAKYMKELGYDETVVKTHMPQFIKKWKEIRDIEWASVMIMKPLDIEEAG